MTDHPNPTLAELHAKADELAIRSIAAWREVEAIEAEQDRLQKQIDRIEREESP